jgi:hypothetical protein
VQEYDAGKAKCSLQKESNLITQKCVKKETAAQNIKNKHKSSIENEKLQVEELKNKPTHGLFNWDLEGPSVDKQNSLMTLCSSDLKGETERVQ